MYSVIRRHISCLLIILNGQDSVFELSQNKKSHWLQVFAQNLGTSPSDHYRVLPIQNSLGTKFHLKLAILIFWTKLTQKRYFQSKIEKNQSQHWVLQTQISLGLYFHLQQIISSFSNKILLTQNSPNSTNNFNFLDQPFLKIIFLVEKQKKVNFTIEFCRFELVLVPDFSLN